jgi:hypothetical protein
MISRSSKDRPLRQSVVHSRHGAIIEDVGVEMNPESGEPISVVLDWTRLLGR